MSTNQEISKTNSNITIFQYHIPVKSYYIKGSTIILNQHDQLIYAILIKHWHSVHTNHDIC